MPDSLIALFISYSHADLAFVNRLEADLSNQGLSPWVDHHSLEGGSKWRRELQEAIDRSQALLVVLSPDAVASEYVQSEYGYALDERKVVIPLYYRQCKVPMDLRGIQWIDFQDSYEQGLEALLRTLRRERSRTTSNDSSASTKLASRQTHEPEKERPWNVPFLRNPFFSGRAHLLERLHDQFSKRDQRSTLTQSPYTYALTGLGGIGKTQMAIEYAYRYREAYSAVFWVQAASRETLVTDFVALAQLLALTVPDIQNQMLIVTAMKNWLMQHDGWLLILDNADDLALLADFLPKGGKGYILLTTRAQATGKIAASLPVEKMDIEEGILLLLHRAKLLDPETSLATVSAALRSQAQKLVEELDGLPLALDQAGAYIEEIGCSVAQYLELFQRRRLALLQRQSVVSAEYPHTVASTWSLSFGQVEQANQAAAELLRVCAFLAPDAIPEEIITEGATELGAVLEPMATDPFLLNEAIQLLRRYSLVKRDPEEKLLNLHRLVQVVLKDSLDRATQRQWAERTVRAVNAAFPEVNFDTWTQCERLLPHVLFCTPLLEYHTFTFPEAGRLLRRAGSYLKERGQYATAEPLLEHALSLTEQALGPQHPDTAQSLNNLAVLYYDQGKYEQAEPLLERALSIREQALGPQHPDTAQSLNDQAILYDMQGKYEQAESLYQRALSIREQVLGPLHCDTAQGLNSMAAIYYAQGKYEQAESLLERALSIREQILSPLHPDIGKSLNNLAAVYENQGKYKQAESLYQRALSNREQVLGPLHPHTAQCLDNLAILYYHQEKYEQAEPLLKRALAIFEQVLGPLHPDTAQALENLAELYRSQDDYEQARQLLDRSLSIREQALGPLHPDTACSLNALGAIYTHQGKYEQAESLLKRALAIREETLGSEHSDTVQSLNDLAELYKSQGRYEQAEPLLERTAS